MTLKEIKERLQGLDISEERAATEEYIEIVFLNSQNSQWKDVFTEILGPAVKPQGAKPTREDNSLTQNYGGIYSNQTLFKKEFDGRTVVAMFWPWQDGVHTTLKIAAL